MRWFVAGLLACVSVQAAEITPNITIDNFEWHRAQGTPLGQVEYRLPGTDKRVVRQIRYADVSWAARMIQGEGASPDVEHAEAVLWTVLQRGLCPVSRSTMTLSAQFRAFSQPINPLWSCDRDSWKRTGARGCARYCDRRRADYVNPKTLPPSSPCSPAKLARRKRMQTMPWASLDPVARQVALDFGLGRLPNPVPGAANFIADCLAHRQRATLAPAFNYRNGAGRTDSCVSVNSFYYENCALEDGSLVWSNQWPLDTVQLWRR